MSDISSTTSSTPTGMTGAGGGNMIRITGMASGLDVDSIVKKMMTAEQTKIDKAKQDQQTIQWKQEAYQGIIKDIKDLQNTYFNSLDSTNNILSSTNYAAFDVTSTSTVSGTTVATASALTGATTGNYILNVQQLANGATINGSTLNTQVQVTDETTPKNFNSADWQGKKISFNVDGVGEQTITLDNTVFTNLSDVISNINKQISANSNLNGKVSASYINIDNGSTDSSTGDYIKFNALTSKKITMVNDTDHPTEISNLSSLINKNVNSISSNTALTSLDTNLNNTLELDLKYNGTDVKVKLDNSSTGKNGAATIGDLSDAINAATGGQVTAKLDGITGKLVLQTTSTGSTTSLSITGDNVGGDTASHKLLNALGTSITATPNQGQDAIVSITPPGTSAATTLTESSNNFTLNSISYSLASTGTTNISVSADTQKVYDKISGFLDKYNAIVDEIQTKLNEKKDYNYPPLTDAQRASMSSSQITAWEDKAKQGVLRNDNNLQDLLSSMRSAFTTAVTNTGLNFGQYGSNSIGLDTSDDVTQGGKITIVDPQKLKAAIAQHSDQILKLFTNVSSSTDKTTAFNENGIFQRLNNIFIDNVGYTGTTLNSAILTKYANYQDDYSLYGSGNNTLPDQLYQQTQLLKNLNTEFSDKQEQYYQQFSTLETALTQLNSQQSMLSSLVSG